MLNFCFYFPHISCSPPPGSECDQCITYRQYTVAFALSIHLLYTSERRQKGTTTCSLLISKPPADDRLDLVDQYGLAGNGQFFLWSGQPFSTNSSTSCNVGLSRIAASYFSLADCFGIIQSRTAFTCSSAPWDGSLSYSRGSGALLRASAICSDKHYAHLHILILFVFLRPLKYHTSCSFQRDHLAAKSPENSNCCGAVDLTPC